MNSHFSSRTLIRNNYEGPSVDVVGTVAAGRNADGSEPTWECMLDGQSTSSATVERDQNNQVLCSFAGLQEGQSHYLTLQTNSNLFSVDYIAYTPSSGNTWNLYRASGTFVSIPSQDSTFSYDSSWVRPSDSGFATVSTVGATFNATFLGIHCLQSVGGSIYRINLYLSQEAP